MPPAAIPLPATENAVYQAALLVQGAWVSAAQSGRYMHTATGAYVQGILTMDSLLYPAEGNPLAALVRNVAPHAGVVEWGHAGYHLPDVIRWSQARTARRTKAGRWYVRIPFRAMTPRAGPGVTHAAQQAMLPRDLYQVARRLAPGERLTAGPSRGRALHAPGMVPYQPRTASNLRPGFHHASIYEGLRRVGARGQTRYMTWRTMTQGSPGWHIPPRPGTHIAATVARDTTAQVQALIEAGMLADIETFLRERLGGRP